MKGSNTPRHANMFRPTGAGSSRVWKADAALPVPLSALHAMSSPKTSSPADPEARTRLERDVAGCGHVFPLGPCRGAAHRWCQRSGGRAAEDSASEPGPGGSHRLLAEHACKTSEAEHRWSRFLSADGPPPRRAARRRGPAGGQDRSIGYLALNLAANPHLREAFRQGLRDLGYVEGRNLVIEYRDAEGKTERLPALAAELVALKVDVIVAARHTARPGRQASDQDPPHCLRCCCRSGCERARHQPCAAGRQCHGVVQPRPGARRQASGTAQAGRSGGRSGRCPLAARCPRRTHGQGHAEGSRSRGTGAGGAASIR